MMQNWYVLRVVHASERVVSQSIPGAWFPLRAYINRRPGQPRVIRYTPLVHGIVFVPDHGQSPYDHLTRHHVISLYADPWGNPLFIPRIQIEAFREKCEMALNSVQIALQPRRKEKRPWVRMDVESLSEALKTLLGPKGFEIEEAA